MLASKADGSGGSTGGSTTGTISVTGTSPAIAPTDTVIDVQVSGSGFAKGATVRWSIAGDTTRVQVLSSTFVNSSTMRARISVPKDAPLGSYDVIVTNIGGKKGIGAELFEVVLGDPDADFYFPSGATTGLMGDNLSTYQSTFGGAPASLYREPVCGVRTRVYETGANPNGDVLLHTNIDRSSSCPDYPRKVVVRYGTDNGSIVDSRPAVVILRDVARPGFGIPVGTTRDRVLFVLFAGKGRGCTELRFNPDNPANSGASLVEVTRVDLQTYRVRSKAGGKAYCADNGALYDVAVDFVVVASRPLAM
jgi:hypothetical protein